MHTQLNLQYLCSKSADLEPYLEYKTYFMQSATFMNYHIMELSREGSPALSLWASSKFWQKMVGTVGTVTEWLQKEDEPTTNMSGR